MCFEIVAFAYGFHVYLTKHIGWRTSHWNKTNFHFPKQLSMCWLKSRFACQLILHDIKQWKMWKKIGTATACLQICNTGHVHRELLSYTQLRCSDQNRCAAVMQPLTPHFLMHAMLLRSFLITYISNKVPYKWNVSKSEKGAPLD